MPKALPTVKDYLAGLPADRRATLTTLHKLIVKVVPKPTPAMMSGMGPTPLIAYGRYHYRYSSGREGDWFLIGLTAAKNNYSLHICALDEDGYLVERNAAKLGKVKAGRSCINFKAIEDLNLDVLVGLMKQAVKTGGMGAVK